MFCHLHVATSGCHKPSHILKFLSTYVKQEPSVTYLFVSESLKRKGGEVDGEKEKPESAPPQKKTKDMDDIMTRTGGAYIPPARLRMMQAQITDKSR